MGLPDLGSHAAWNFSGAFVHYIAQLCWKVAALLKDAVHSEGTVQRSGFSTRDLRNSLACLNQKLEVLVSIEVCRIQSLQDSTTKDHLLSHITA